ncbi:MAG: hypothetical protein IPK99_04505 [Flavobacteriales bacterium]|nr:hypothetical protein [Flavobacteriales bacterium]
MEELLKEAPDKRGHGPAPAPAKNGSGQRAITLLDFLLRKKLWILGAGALTGLLVAGQYVREPVLYSSSVVFFVDPDPPPNRDDMRSTDLVSGNIRRLFHVATSTAMNDHLIQSFDLYGHFGIDTTEALHEEWIYGLLWDRVTARFVDDNSLSITVRDADRTTAAAMANEIFEQLEVLTRAQALAAMERKGAVYREAMDQVEQRTKAQTDELVALATEFERRTERAGAGGHLGEPGTVVGFQLAQIVAKLTSANEELASKRRDLEISAAVIREQQVPVLHLARKAIRDIETFPLLEAGKGVAALVLVVMLLVTALLMLWFKHGRELKDYFHGINAAT